MRIKGGVVTHRRHKKILESVKGYRMARSKNVRKAIEAELHAKQYAYRHRQKRAAQMRRVWVTRLNNYLDEKGISYSKWIATLKSKNVELNRKMLSELAINQPEIIEEIIKFAK